MPNFFVDSNKQKAANEALARGEKDYMQTGLKAPASNTKKPSRDRKFGSFSFLEIGSSIISFFSNISSLNFFIFFS